MAKEKASTKKLRAELERAVARARLARVREAKNLYEAASNGRRTQHWRASTLDANAEVGAAIDKLRAVSRDMVRNNPYAARAKMVIAHNIVGPGIIARVEGVGKRAKDLLRQHFETTDIDADGRHNIYGLQSLAMATVVEAGEVIIRRRVRRSEDGYALPFQLQILEPDYIDTTKHGALENGNYVIQGIEFNAFGQRVAYWLHQYHPGSDLTPRFQSSAASQRVSADFVAHIYRVDRPGQARGVSWFAPVILRMRDFADFTDAQLVRQKIAACFSAFITTSEGFTGTPDGNSDYPVETFEPGMIERLREGESVSFANPPSTQDFGPYSQVTLREIASGLGITYEALTGDLTGVNYSSGRMGWLEFQRNIDSWRWLMLIPQMLDRVALWAGDALGTVTGTSVRPRFAWTPPRREMIDPVVELEASTAAIRAGLTSRSEEIRRLGYDPMEVEREIADDNARADSMSLTFDSDPRKTQKNGAQQAVQPAQGDLFAPPIN